MSIIDVASDRTGAVQQKVERAIDILSNGFRGRILNGSGIYHNPSARLAELTAALNCLKAARDVMAATTWPTEADYDADGVRDTE